MEQPPEMQQDNQCRREPTPGHHHHHHHHDYLQFLHPLVVVGDGRLQGLEELLLCLQLVAHRPCPRVPRLGVLRLTDVGDGRALGTGGLDPEHPALRVSIHLLLELHFVHLQWKCCSLGYLFYL